LGNGSEDSDPCKNFIDPECHKKRAVIIISWLSNLIENMILFHRAFQSLPQFPTTPPPPIRVRSIQI
jgi:hypothetical protein